MSIYAFIPIRHDSQRLPGKNWRLLGNKPLYHYIIETLLEVEEITGIIIDTNSPIIKEGIKRWNYDKERIILIDRDTNLIGSNVSTNLLIHSLFQHNLFQRSHFQINNFDFLDDSRTIYLQTHVTNPFLKVETIRAAIEQYKKVLHNRTHDSLFSVNSWKTRLYDYKFQPVNHDPTNLIQTQDLPSIYEDNSCLYLFTRDSFLNNNDNRVGLKPYFFEMKDGEETVDIDWLEEFELAEAYLRIRDKRKNSQKFVLITGVSGGIGWETAKIFKQEGWSVIGTDLEERKENPEAAPYDYFIAVDLSREGSQDRLYDGLSVEISRLDSLINIAATQICKNLRETDSESWNDLMSCNLKAPYFLIQKFLPLLSKTRGSIVNVSSVHAFQTSAEISAYAISKAGLSGLTRSLAVELGKEGIRVNSVCPGAIDTPMLRSGLSRGLTQNPVEKLPRLLSNELYEKVHEELPLESCQKLPVEKYEEFSVKLSKELLGQGIAISKSKERNSEYDTEMFDELVHNLGKKHLMGSVGHPSDVAQAIFFLADNAKSGFMTGTNLVVDGGATIRLSTE